MTTVCGRPEMPSHVRSPHWPISHCPLNSSLHLLYCLSNMLNSTLCKSQLIQTCPFSILSCWTPPALCRQNAQKHTWFRHVCTVSCFGRPVGCLSVSLSLDHPPPCCLPAHFTVYLSTCPPGYTFSSPPYFHHLISILHPSCWRHLSSASC